MSLLYVFISMAAATIGAISPKATNIAVINATIRQDSKQAFKIAIGSGFAEVVLSITHCITI